MTRLVLPAIGMCPVQAPLSDDHQRGPLLGLTQRAENGAPCWSLIMVEDPFAIDSEELATYPVTKDGLADALAEMANLVRNYRDE